MKICSSGKYTFITHIPSLNPKGEIRQLYNKQNGRMIQLLVTDTYIKRSVVDTHAMKTLQETVRETGSNLIKVIKNH